MGAAAEYDCGKQISEPHFQRYYRGEIEFGRDADRVAPRSFLRELGREAGQRTEPADLETAASHTLNRSFVLCRRCRLPASPLCASVGALGLITKQTTARISDAKLARGRTRRLVGRCRDIRGGGRRQAGPGDLHLRVRGARGSAERGDDTSATVLDADAAAARRRWPKRGVGWIVVVPRATKRRGAGIYDPGRAAGTGRAGGLSRFGSASQRPVALRTRLGRQPRQPAFGVWGNGSSN